MITNKVVLELLENHWYPQIRQELLHYHKRLEGSMYNYKLGNSYG